MKEPSDIRKKKICIYAYLIRCWSPFCQLQSFAIESSCHFWTDNPRTSHPSLSGKGFVSQKGICTSLLLRNKSCLFRFCHDTMTYLPLPPDTSRCPPGPWIVKEQCPYIGLTFTCKHKELRRVKCPSRSCHTKLWYFGCPRLILGCSMGHRDHT